MKSPCAEIQKYAAGLASLRPDDPERHAATTHAMTCGGCAAALAEGQEVLALLDVVLPLEAPRSEALARARSGVLAAAHERGAVPAHKPQPRGAGGGTIAVLGAALLLEWVAFTLKHWRDEAAMGFSIALAALAVALGVGPIVRWAGPRALIPLPIVAALAALAALVGVEGDAGVQAAYGFKCAFELVVAAGAPVALALVLARRGVFPRPEVALAAAAGGGVLDGLAALRLGCHAGPSVLHTLLFHALPAVLIVPGCYVAAHLIATARRPSDPSAR